jgi:hypothetical protein
MGLVIHYAACVLRIQKFRGQPGSPDRADGNWCLQQRENMGVELHMAYTESE